VCSSDLYLHSFLTSAVDARVRQRMKKRSLSLVEVINNYKHKHIINKAQIFVNYNAPRALPVYQSSPSNELGCLEAMLIIAGLALRDIITSRSAHCMLLLHRWSTDGIYG
jgi:hypothetical protein